MNKRTQFSVSMCVYGKDNPEHFSAALDSVIFQTLVPDEIVLVVDGPIPKEIQKVINDKKNLYSELKVTYLPQNVGHGEARRIGLSKCKYDYVALMDSDDISIRERFEKQIEVFTDHPEISVVGGNITEFVDTPQNIVGKRNVPENDKEIKKYMKTRCPMNQVTVMFRKKDAEAVGGYIDWFCEEDYYLWLRMMLGGYRFANIGDTLVYVRVGQDMYMRRGGRKYFLSEARLQKYMLKNGIVGIPTYTANVLKRLIVQILLPNKIRGWVFQKFAREKA